MPEPEPEPLPPPKPPNPNSLGQPAGYFRLTGVLLGVLAVLGIVVRAANNGEFLGEFLAFDWTHNVLHILLAAVAVLLGWGNIAPSVTKMFAIVLGSVYIVLGGVGFIPVVADWLGSTLELHVELVENIVHILIGLYGLVVGLVAPGKPRESIPEPMM